MPVTDLVGIELGNLGVAKDWQDKSLKTLLGVMTRRSALQPIDVSDNGILDRVGASLGRLASAPRIFLSLPKIENPLAIGVENVIGFGNGFEVVGLISEIAANDPHTASLALAVADVKSATNSAPVRLAAHREFAAGLSAFYRSVPNASGHGPVSNSVQYTDKNGHVYAGT